MSTKKAEPDKGFFKPVEPKVAEDAKRLAKDADNWLHNNEHKQLVQYGLMAIGAFVVLKILAQSLFWVVFLAGPFMYVYLTQTCPTEESFDSQKELKRVLRGHHLAEDHPDKPKSYFEKMTAKVQASVQTTVMTSLPGSQQVMTNYHGAFWIAKVEVSSMNMQYWWIGALNDWTYVYSAEMGKDAKTSPSNKKKD